MTAVDETGAGEDRQHPATAVTNAVLKQQLGQHSEQLSKLWDLNTRQMLQLAKLEDVPGKLDQLLLINNSLATLAQQGLQHGEALATLKTRADAQEQRHSELDRKVTSKFSYYAGAMAVVGLVMGACMWLAQQAITSAFAKLAEVDHSISEIHGDVDLLKFKSSNQK